MKKNKKGFFFIKHHVDRSLGSAKVLSRKVKSPSVCVRHGFGNNAVYVMMMMIMMICSI